MASPYTCKNHNFKLDPLVPTFLQEPVSLIVTRVCVNAGMVWYFESWI